MKLRTAISILKKVGPFTASSVAGGWVNTYPAWPNCKPKGCRFEPALGQFPSTDPYFCTACDQGHTGGAFDRMAVAEAIAVVLNAAMKPARRRRKE